jgi:hypothetical protein
MTTPDQIDVLRDLAAQRLKERVGFPSPVTSLPDEQQAVWRDYVNTVLSVFIEANYDRLRYVSVREQDSRELSLALGVAPGALHWGELVRLARAVREGTTPEAEDHRKFNIASELEIDRLRAALQQTDAMLTEVDIRIGRVLVVCEFHDDGEDVEMTSLIQKIREILRPAKERTGE